MQQFKYECVGLQWEKESKNMQIKNAEENTAEWETKSELYIL